MKQLIILLLLPAFAFSQTKGVVIKQKPDTTGKWHTMEPAYTPDNIRRFASWEINRWSKTEQYIIQSDTIRYFHAILKCDTLHIDHSLFDSTAGRAKVIIVAGKTFELKNNK
jgi:hypothetical protein